MINDIVFQTKLLSFNASVEAARAGEHGKGFAVVAEEVGNLAAMSGNAAVEITMLLENSVQKVEEIAKNSQEKVGVLIAEGKSNVDAGVRIAKESGSILNEIVGSVASVSSAITEISSASQEQSQGMQEITKALGQLDQMTQQNTSNAAESAHAAEALSKEAHLLKNLILDLTKTIEGKSGHKNDIPPGVTKVSKAKKAMPHFKLEKKNENHLPKGEDHRFVDV